MKHSIVHSGCVMVCVWRAIKYFVCVFDVFQFFLFVPGCVCVLGCVCVYSCV